MVAIGGIGLSQEGGANSWFQGSTSRLDGLHGLTEHRGLLRALYAPSEESQETLKDLVDCRLRITPKGKIRVGCPLRNG